MVAQVPAEVPVPLHYFFGGFRFINERRRPQTIHDSWKKCSLTYPETSHHHAESIFFGAPQVYQVLG